MRSRTSIAALLVPLVVVGCSAVSDFDYEFADDAGRPDGGESQAGGGGESGDGAGGAAATGGGGESGAGNGGESGAGSGGESSAGTGGESGAGSGGESSAGTGGESSAGTGGEPPECGPDDPCANGWPCQSGVCTPECDGDNPCNDHYRCDEGLCVPECDADHLCGPGFVCSDEGFCLLDRSPTGVAVTSGGGTVTSTNFSLRVSVGMPQPMGVTEGSSFRVTVGPGAGRP